jgi:hypothetical protein
MNIKKVIPGLHLRPIETKDGKSPPLCHAHLDSPWDGSPHNSNFSSPKEEAVESKPFCETKCNRLDSKLHIFMTVDVYCFDLVGPSRNN